jgi:hypothetical protein
VGVPRGGTPATTPAVQRHAPTPRRRWPRADGTGPPRPTHVNGLPPSLHQPRGNPLRVTAARVAAVCARWNRRLPLGREADAMPRPRARACVCAWACVCLCARARVRLCLCLCLCLCGRWCARVFVRVRARERVRARVRACVLGWLCERACVPVCVYERVHAPLCVKSADCRLHMSRRSCASSRRCRERFRDRRD